MATTAKKAEKKRKEIVKNDGDVGAFLRTVADAARREDSGKLVAIMQRASRQPPQMWGRFIVGFGAYRYRLASGAQGEAPVIAFSPRSANFALYHIDIASNGPLLKRLGKFKTGRKCLYLKRLAEVDVKALEQLCALSYRSVVAAHGQGE